MADDKSCKACPQYVTETQAQEEVRGGIGGGFCRMHGFVLGKPGLSPAAVDSLCVKFAEGCSDFGSTSVPVGGVNPIPTAMVTTPDMDVLTAMADPSFTPAGIGTCMSCANFVDASAVRDELGWSIGLCAATGRLIFPAQQTQMPRVCGAAVAGPRRDTTDGLLLDPRYDSAFRFDDDTSRVEVHENDLSVIGLSEEFEDPRTRPTDKPLQGWEESYGIRAWRKVASPIDSSKFTFLPIFHTEFFPEVEQELIPQLGDASRPELYVDHQGLLYDLAVNFIELERTPAMTGDAGVGKTEVFNFGAWLCQMPSRVLSYRPDTDVDELVGKWLFRDGETVWAPGRLDIGITRPGWLLGDEMNTAPEDVWELHRPLFDSRRYLVLDQKEGEKHSIDNWCFFGVAMNPGWDSRYVGTKELSEADRDRLAHLIVGLPPEHLERKILLRRLRQVHGWEPSTEFMDKLMGVAETLRRMGAEGGLSVAWGMRAQFKTLENSKWFPIEKSYRMAMLNDLEPQTVEQVLTVVRDFF